MDEELICEGCYRKVYDEDELWKINCNFCKESYNLCETCASVARTRRKCIECLNDGK